MPVAQWVPSPGAHWLRAHTRTRVPRRFVFFDTEAYRDRQPSREVQTWRCGVTGAIRWRKEPAQWSELVVKRHSAPEDLWREITGFSVKDGRTIVVAHNLGYDLRVSRAFDVLPALGWTVGRPVLAGDHVSVDATCDGKTLCLVDSRTVLPKSLADIAARLGKSKVLLPNDDDPQGTWFDRCETDVRLLAEAYMDIVNWLVDEDLGNWARTGPSTGWNVMLRRHLTEKVLVHANPTVRELEARAMYAGRAETWKWGKLKGGPWYVWDYRNAYAEVCRTTALPAVLRSEVRGVGLPTMRRYEADTRWLVEAEVRTSVPILPVTDADGVFWPVGSFSGWWWDTELLAADHVGVCVKVRRAWKYKASPWLANWAEWVIGQIASSGTSSENLRSVAAKHWARAVPGRSAMRFWDFHDWGESYVPGAQAGPIHDLDAGTEGAMVQVGSRRWEAWQKTWWEQALPQVLSFIMAESRVRLWDAMAVAGFEHVVWVHTDCLVVDTIGHERLRAAVATGRLGSLRYKSTQSSFEPVTPYLVEGSTYRVRAGVPRKSWVDEKGSRHGEHWETLSGALSHGRSDRVIVTDHIFEPDLTDTRRVHLPDGETAPFGVIDGVRSPAVSLSSRSPLLPGSTSLAISRPDGLLVCS